MNLPTKSGLLVLGFLVACADPAGSAPRARHEALEEAADRPDEGQAQVDGVGELRTNADPNDLDRDGVPVEADLDDLDELVGAQRTEIPCDGIDEDGDLVDPCPPDVDGDGVRGEADCNDLDPDVGPAAREVWCNGRDENCNGVDDCDRDGDGLRDGDDPDPDDPAVVLPDDRPRARWR